MAQYRRTVTDYILYASHLRIVHLFGNHLYQHDWVKSPSFGSCIHPLEASCMS